MIYINLFFFQDIHISTRAIQESNGDIIQYYLNLVENHFLDRIIKPVKDWIYGYTMKIVKIDERYMVSRGYVVIKVRFVIIR